MPPRKRNQSNAMLYTLIAFIGLFIIATTCAVIFYVKTEDLKTREAAAIRARDELAIPREQQQLGTIVGTKQAQSWLGTMVQHFDDSIKLVTGSAPRSDVPADVKLAQAMAKVQATLALTADYVDLSGADPNTTGLTYVIESLKTELDKAAAATAAQKTAYDDLLRMHEDMQQAMKQQEQYLLAEKDRLQQEVDKARQDYKDLKAQLQQTNDQWIQRHQEQLAKEQAAVDRLNDQIAAKQAELDLITEKLKRAQLQVAKIQPPPDSNAPAMAADGEIILYDYVSKVVHINKGSDDRVYRGLTFAVHDKNAPIRPDGKGKAEIEVFDVGKNFSTARVVSSDPRKPILEGDLISNLIWDSAKRNVFVIAGQFDIDNDGSIDADAHAKVKALVEKWGGKVQDEVTADTDFVVLGKLPPLRKKPTFEEIEIDPQANQKYQQSVRDRENYQKIQEQAKALWIPVFTYDRFLYFTGYKNLSAKAGAF